MEQYLKDLASSPSEGNSSTGPFRIPSVNVSRKVGSGAWGIPHGSYSAYASTDASLFSSSLPVLKHDKLNFDDLDNFHQSLDDGFPSLNKVYSKGMGTLDDIEPHVIGAFLPGEEELLAGIMDDFDLSGLPSKLEDLEDDFFVSGGGMELDADPQEALNFSMSSVSISEGSGVNGVFHYGIPNGIGTVVGEHPYGEHPSRTLFVRNINSNVEDSELKDLFEEYGDIRTLYTACKHRGFVMISYYDIRAARMAMRALQNKPLRRRKLDIHFSIPKDNPSEKDVNQGTLVVFNLDASVSNEDLLQLFGAYGEVKEIRETPHKRHHKFIEFYDVRAAEAALKALNRCDIAGKRIKLEPSRPGGARRNLMLQLNQEMEQDEARSFRHQIGSPIANSPPGNWAQIGSPIGHNPLQAFEQSQSLGTFSPIYSNHLPGLASILPTHVSNSSKIPPIGKHQGGMNQLFGNDTLTDRGAYQCSHSFPEQKFRASPGPTSSSESNSNSLGIGTLSGPQFLWGSPTPQSEHTNSSACSTSSAGQPFISIGRGQSFPYFGSRRSVLGSHHQHVGSAPSGVHLERQFGFFPESPDSSFMSPVLYGDIGIDRNNGSYMRNMGAFGAMSGRVAALGSMSENFSPHFRMAPIPMHRPMFFGNGSFPGLVNGNEGFAEHSRRRVEISESQMESKKQYQLELDKIISGEDTRTTLMIKNIPNKYTSKMLLSSIDENHRGTYDFLYLPIDFKNKCNVGYAFINMVSPSHIASFYKDFNGRKWEKFNSEKVASLAYARIQGKAALVTHFQNSSLMNEDRRCRPILFHSEGQETGDQELLAYSNLNICIRQPDGSFSSDALDMEENLELI